LPFVKIYKLIAVKIKDKMLPVPVMKKVLDQQARQQKRHRQKAVPEDGTYRMGT